MLDRVRRCRRPRRTMCRNPGAGAAVGQSRSPESFRRRRCRPAAWSSADGRAHRRSADGSSSATVIAIAGAGSDHPRCQSTAASSASAAPGKKAMPAARRAGLGAVRSSGRIGRCLAGLLPGHHRHGCHRHPPVGTVIDHCEATGSTCPPSAVTLSRTVSDGGRSVTIRTAGSPSTIASDDRRRSVRAGRQVRGHLDGRGIPAIRHPDSREHRRQTRRWSARRGTPRVRWSGPAAAMPLSRGTISASGRARSEIGSRPSQVRPAARRAVAPAAPLVAGPTRTTAGTPAGGSVRDRCGRRPSGPRFP